MYITTELVEEYRRRLVEGNRYINGEISGIHVSYRELGGHSGIRLVYRNGSCDEFGIEDKEDIEGKLLELGY